MVAALFFGAATYAFGWSASFPYPNTLEVVRSSGETGTLTFTVYQVQTLPSSGKYADGSYDETSSGGSFYNAGANTIVMDSGALASDFPIGSQYAAALVAGPGGKSEVFVGARMPTAVFLAHAGSQVEATATTVTVSAPVSVAGTVPVSQVASISVAGTMPVDVLSSVGLSTFDGQVLLTLGVMVVGVGLGYKLG